jgi:hypothetical protein
MVWVFIGKSSAVAFNALKKNGIQVYPISAKQYVNGAWVDVTAKSYQNGKWVDWILYCYHPTKGYIGQWGSVAYVDSGSTSTPITANITHNADSMTVTSTDSGTSLIYNDELINFGGITALMATACIDHPDNMIIRLQIIGAIKNGYTIIAEAEIPRSGEEETVEIPLNGDAFEGYVAFRFYANRSGKTLTINSVKIERE